MKHLHLWGARRLGGGLLWQTEVAQVTGPACDEQQVSGKAVWLLEPVGSQGIQGLLGRVAGLGVVHCPL